MDWERRGWIGRVRYGLGEEGVDWERKVWIGRGGGGLGEEGVNWERRGYRVDWERRVWIGRGGYGLGVNNCLHSRCIINKINDPCIKIKSDS